MAKYVTDSEFRRQVRVCLDENMSSEVLQYLEDVDTLSLDDIIDSKVEDAALSVVRSAPISKLGDILKSLDGVPDIAQTAPYKGVMRLPLDFERLVRFKMKGWPLALYGAQPPLSPYYEQANSEFSVFGTKDRPVVFLVPSADNASDLCAEIFCASSQDDVLDGCTYVAKPRIEEDETKTTESWKILLGENLVRPTVYYAAYLTALAVKDDNAAEKLLATATSLIEN